jgi:hypothetical protein
MKSSLLIKSMMITGAVLGWFAVIGQLVLILQNRVLTVPGTIVQFFSYFTILTNIIVALCYTFLLMDRGEEKQRRPVWLFISWWWVLSIIQYFAFSGLQPACKK